MSHKSFNVVFPLLLSDDGWVRSSSSSSSCESLQYWNSTLHAGNKTLNRLFTYIRSQSERKYMYEIAPHQTKNSSSSSHRFPLLRWIKWNSSERVKVKWLWQRRRLHWFLSLGVGFYANHEWAMKSWMCRIATGLVYWWISRWYLVNSLRIAGIQRILSQLTTTPTRSVQRAVEK